MGDAMFTSLERGKYRVYIHRHLRIYSNHHFDKKDIFTRYVRREASRLYRTTCRKDAMFTSPTRVLRVSLFFVKKYITAITQKNISKTLNLISSELSLVVCFINLKKMYFCTLKRERLISILKLSYLPFISTLRKIEKRCIDRIIVGN